MSEKRVNGFNIAARCKMQLQRGLLIDQCKRKTFFKENLNASRPPEHPPIKGENVINPDILRCKRQQSSPIGCNCILASPLPSSLALPLNFGG